MKRSIIKFCCLCMLIFGTFLSLAVTAPTPRLHAQKAAPADFPTVNPDYIYDQLFYMVTHFQHREAGYGNSGHDAFASYWSQEMLHNLQGFGTQSRQDTFTVSGWHDRPATTHAFNVEVTVPGGVHPEQVVVIGCHYDGEAFSTQSANDDASGCAIELGVAQAMGNYWHSHHVYPARTLRFVIFDAEEQGLYGSFHYLNDTINGDVQNIVAMFNEEQNGIAYPLRYLGQAANPLLPFNIEMSPLQNNALYPAQSKLSQTQQENIKHFRALMQQAVFAAFAQFQALGFQGLTYHDENNEAQAQPIFTPEQINNIHQEDDGLGGSDQMPFTLAGLPCATFVGNYSYYDNKPPAWSYPYDQPQDTIQLMNTFADGSSHKAHALTLSLALPGMLTTWMLHQPDILGETSANMHPFAAISDIGQTLVNKSIVVDARSSFDPEHGTTPLTYTWDFGDGTTANGSSVDHTYTRTGNYTITLTAHSARGSERIHKNVLVANQPIVYNNPYKGYIGDGRPQQNPSVELPQPNDSLSDQIVSLSSQVTPVAHQTSQKTPPQSSPFNIIAGMLLLLIAIAGCIGVAIRLTRKKTYNT